MTTYQSSSSAASMTNKAPPSGVKKHRESTCTILNQKVLLMTKINLLLLTSDGLVQISSIT